ncbi:MAG TPA: hypothetical protein ACFYD2_09735 [Candidatus Avalokitesvara rifleensis]|uniref:hypothetical protein n=1 Tax=Candidatus Avalokitesvara rifleensis TaxID=3367620 RepID=UPI002713295E|nr:hypothetical protein [Candidatus Brocadiales bacterium]
MGDFAKPRAINPTLVASAFTPFLLSPYKGNDEEQERIRQERINSELLLDMMMGRTPFELWWERERRRQQYKNNPHGKFGPGFDRPMQELFSSPSFRV